MTSKIISTVSIKGLDEIESILGFRPEVERTKKKLQVKQNPYFKCLWGDFDWIRSLFTGEYDVRCYATSASQLKKAGVKGHIGMYDLTDNDGVLDFYIGIPNKLDARAKKNGFKNNAAWLFCHEWCHGKEQNYGGPDRTHDMEKRGRLKELLEEQVTKDGMVKKIGLLETIVSLLKKLRV